MAAGEIAGKLIVAMLKYKPVKCRPVNQLEQVMKHAILMAHGIAPFVSR